MLLNIIVSLVFECLNVFHFSNAHAGSILKKRVVAKGCGYFSGYIVAAKLLA
jgi:hypothetical protein